MSAIKKSIVVTRHFLFSSCINYRFVRGKRDTKYALYRDGKGLKQPVKNALNASGVHFTNAVGIEELEQFESIFRTTKLLCMMV